MSFHNKKQSFNFPYKVAIQQVIEISENCVVFLSESGYI